MCENMVELKNSELTSRHQLLDWREVPRGANHCLAVGKPVRQAPPCAAAVVLEGQEPDERAVVLDDRHSRGRSVACVDDGELRRQEWVREPSIKALPLSPTGGLGIPEFIGTTDCDLHARPPYTCRVT
jgi:hypothetical protein